MSYPYAFPQSRGWWRPKYATPPGYHQAMLGDDAPSALVLKVSREYGASVKTRRLPVSHGVFNNAEFWRYKNPRQFDAAAPLDGCGGCSGLGATGTAGTTKTPKADDSATDWGETAKVAATLLGGMALGMVLHKIWTRK